MLARIARDVEPMGFAAASRYHPHPNGGIGLPRLGILQPCHLMVEGVGGIDQGDGLHALGVELPVGQVFPTGTPAEAVAESQLLLIDPVGGPVDDLVRGALGHLQDRAVGQSLHIEIFLVHIGHLAGIGTQLGEHQAGLVGVAANLKEVIAVHVEQPVVASGLGAPHLHGITEEQALLTVFRPAIVLDDQGLGLRSGYQQGDSDAHHRLTAIGIGKHHLLYVIPVNGLFELHIPRAIIEPPNPFDGFQLEIVGVKDLLQGQAARIRGGGFLPQSPIQPAPHATARQPQCAQQKKTQTLPFHGSSSFTRNFLFRRPFLKSPGFSTGAKAGRLAPCLANCIAQRVLSAGRAAVLLDRGGCSSSRGGLQVCPDRRASPRQSPKRIVR